MMHQQQRIPVRRHQMPDPSVSISVHQWLEWYLFELFRLRGVVFDTGTGFMKDQTGNAPGWNAPREGLTLSGAVFRVARVMQPRQFLLLLPAGLLLGLAPSCSRSPSPPTAEPAPVALGIGLASPIPLEESAAAIPALGAYLDEVKTALASDRPVVGVEAAAAADPARRDAVTLALADLRFARDFVHRDTGEPLHNEILRAEPDPSDVISP